MAYAWHEGEKEKEEKKQEKENKSCWLPYK